MSTTLIPDTIAKLWTPHSRLLQLFIKNKPPNLSGWFTQPSQTYQQLVFLHEPSGMLNPEQTCSLNMFLAFCEPLPQ